MAKVTITLEDTDTDGDPMVALVIMVALVMTIDRQGQTADAPATDAIMYGLAVGRLWTCDALSKLVPFVCGDALHNRAELVRRTAAAQGGSAAPASEFKLARAASGVRRHGRSGPKRP